MTVVARDFPRRLLPEPPSCIPTCSGSCRQQPVCCSPQLPGQTTSLQPLQVSFWSGRAVNSCLELCCLLRISSCSGVRRCFSSRCRFAPAFCPPYVFPPRLMPRKARTISFVFCCGVAMFCWAASPHCQISCWSCRRSIAGRCRFRWQRFPCCSVCNWARASFTTVLRGSRTGKPSIS